MFSLEFSTCSSGLLELLSNSGSGVRLTQMVEDVVKPAVGIPDVAGWRRQGGKVTVEGIQAVLFVERQQNVADLCNDLFYSGVGFL